MLKKLKVPVIQVICENEETRYRIAYNILYNATLKESIYLF